MKVRQRIEEAVPSLTRAVFDERIAEVRELLDDPRDRGYGRMERDRLVCEVLRAIGDGQATEPEAFARECAPLFEREVWYA